MNFDPENVIFQLMQHRFGEEIEEVRLFRIQISFESPMSQLSKSNKSKYPSPKYGLMSLIYYFERTKYLA